MTTLRPEITGRACGDKPKLPKRGLSERRTTPMADEEDITAKVEAKPKPETPAEPVAELKARQQQQDQEARQAAEARAHKAEAARQHAAQQAQTTRLEPLGVSPRETGQLLDILAVSIATAATVQIAVFIWSAGTVALMCATG
jgi:hypothetical protein